MAAKRNTPSPPATSPPIRWRVLPFRVTQAGVVFLGLTGFLLISAINSGVNLLYFVFGMLVATWPVSMILAAWTLRGIAIEREPGAPLIAGEETDIVYTVANRKRFWPTISLDLRERHGELVQAPEGFILYLPARRRGHDPVPVSLTARLIARRRGVLKLSLVELSTSFPFGFIRWTRRLRAPQELVVYPHIGMLSRHLALQYRESIETGTMTSNRRGGNDEFYGVREYRPGDNIRIIHWRSTARRGQLMIRELASNAPPQLIVVLNLRTWREAIKPGAAPGLPEDPVERAIELAAALVCYGFYENFAVALAIAGMPDQPPPAPQMGRDARARALRQLAMLDAHRIEDEPIDFPNRLVGRAEWVIVTLRGSDPTRDLLPPGAAAMPAGHAGAARRTVLALDAPDSRSWVHFLSHQDTLRLLRDRGT